MGDTDIRFIGKILDNVHGFISYTEAEDQIMCLLLFKRLKSIKQLSLVNWVFPGSEHTRFIHSLGVMHIADKIALQLNLSNNERKMVRLAGLLHDIGHYPLSHVCEFPYKKKMLKYNDDKFCDEVNMDILGKIEDFSTNHKPEIEFMKKANIGHHEEIGSLVIRNNIDIKKIIEAECGPDAIEVICDMITGNIDRENTPSLLVQLLHSELDADGIDYMLRDAVFSGTSFGSFEVEQLIRCMTIKEVAGKKILCITPKGIAAADQYLINKFFSYSQVVFNKHTVVLEWMAEQVVSWMQENSTYFPSKRELREVWIAEANDIDMHAYINFTDNFFWSSIKNIIENPAHHTFPTYIVNLCKMLLQHQELTFVADSELKIISNDNDKIKSYLEKSKVFTAKGDWGNRITIFNSREITKHVSIDEYREMLELNKENDEEPEGSDWSEFLKQQEIRRLMDGISVADGEYIHLLCDDCRSLMQQLSRTRLVVVRTYDFVT